MELGGTAVACVALVAFFLLFFCLRPAPLVLSATWDPELVEIWDRAPRPSTLCTKTACCFRMVSAMLLHVAASAIYPVRKEWKPMWNPLKG